LTRFSTFCNHNRKRRHSKSALLAFGWKCRAALLSDCGVRGRPCVSVYSHRATCTYICKREGGQRFVWRASEREKARARERHRVKGRGLGASLRQTGRISGRTPQTAECVCLHVSVHAHMRSDLNLLLGLDRLCAEGDILLEKRLSERGRARHVTGKSEGMKPSERVERPDILSQTCLARWRSSSSAWPTSSRVVSRSS
jgi:hypothetical protein